MKLIRALLLCAIGISFSAVLGAVADDVDGSEKVLSRQKRFKETGCTVTPETDEYEVKTERVFEYY